MNKSAQYAVGAVILAAAYRAWSGMSATTTPADALLSDFQNITGVLMNNPASSMNVSENGINAIAGREGFAAMKYPDASGYSIGYGHFIKPFENYDSGISEPDAHTLLRSDAGHAANAVSGYVTVQLTQNQFDALASFVYNVGVGAFKTSTLLKLLNAGDYAGAVAQFARWHTPASVIPRRDSETSQFQA